MDASTSDGGGKAADEMGTKRSDRGLPQKFVEFVIAVNKCRAVIAVKAKVRRTVMIVQHSLY